jgi:hypothetical protein
MSSCKALVIFCHILKKLEFSRQIFRKILKISNAMKIRPVGSRVVPSGRTDRHDEANGRFSQFCERA